MKRWRRSDRYEGERLWMDVGVREGCRPLMFPRWKVDV